MFNQVDLLRPGLLGKSRVDFRNKCFDAVGHHEACTLRTLALTLTLTLTLTIMRRARCEP